MPRKLKMCTKYYKFTSLPMGKDQSGRYDASRLTFHAGTVLVAIAQLIIAGFVYWHCAGSWARLENKHSKDSSAFH